MTGKINFFFLYLYILHQPNLSSISHLFLCPNVSIGFASCLSPGAPSLHTQSSDGFGPVWVVSLPSHHFFQFLYCLQDKFEGARRKMIRKVWHPIGWRIYFMILNRCITALYSWKWREIEEKQSWDRPKFRGSFLNNQIILLLVN